MINSAYYNMYSYYKYNSITKVLVCVISVEICVSIICKALFPYAGKSEYSVESLVDY